MAGQGLELVLELMLQLGLENVLVLKKKKLVLEPVHPLFRTVVGTEVLTGEVCNFQNFFVRCFI